MPLFLFVGLFVRLYVFWDFGFRAQGFRFCVQWYTCSTTQAASSEANGDGFGPGVAAAGAAAAAATAVAVVNEEGHEEVGID